SRRAHPPVELDRGARQEEGAKRVLLSQGAKPLTSVRRRVDLDRALEAVAEPRHDAMAKRRIDEPIPFEIRGKRWGRIIASAQEAQERENLGRRAPGGGERRGSDSFLRLRIHPLSGIRPLSRSS